MPIPPRGFLAISELRAVTYIITFEPIMVSIIIYSIASMAWLACNLGVRSKLGFFVIAHSLLIVSVYIVSYSKGMAINSFLE
jgi:hypothetical protein